MEELGIDYGHAGYLVLIVTVMMGMFLFGGNYLLGRISSVTAMSLGLFCLTLDEESFFLGRSLPVLLARKALCGIGYGLIICASVALIASTFPKKQIGIANGLHACISALSITCAYQFIIPLTDNWVIGDERSYFGLYAVWEYSDC